VLTGAIKLFNADRGFGFIKPDDAGPDVFFHVSALETLQHPQPGQRVSFEMGVDKRNGREKATIVRQA
jgi:CspA family cold shock protein